MTKRLVDIDDGLLERARSVAGTDTIKATVDTALRRLVDHEKVLRHIERLRGPGGIDLARIEVARRPRVTG
jgi:Arc/MetJ family transcription regulator